MSVDAMSDAEALQFFTVRLQSSPSQRELAELFDDVISRFDISSHVAAAVLAYRIKHTLTEHETAAQILKAIIRKQPNANLITYCAYKAIDSGNMDLLYDMVTRLEALFDTLDDVCTKSLSRCASALGRHDLALRAFEKLAERQSPWTTTVLKNRLLAAIDNQKLVTGIRVISIGDNCLPWLMLNRWGLRYQPWRREVLSPFNLASTFTNSVTKFLTSKGDLLLQDLDFREVKNVVMPYSRSMPTVFNHEAGEYWSQDDFRNLRERFSERIRNFDAFLDGGPRLFVHFCQRKGDLKALGEALRNANRDGDYRLLVIDTIACADRGLDLPQGDILSIRPPDDYVWFRPENFESESGLAYEGKIADAVIAALGKIR